MTPPPNAGLNLVRSFLTSLGLMEHPDVQNKVTHLNVDQVESALRTLSRMGPTPCSSAETTTTPRSKLSSLETFDNQIRSVLQTSVPLTVPQLAEIATQIPKAYTVMTAPSQWKVVERGGNETPPPLHLSERTLVPFGAEHSDVLTAGVEILLPGASEVYNSELDCDPSIPDAYKGDTDPGYRVRAMTKSELCEEMAARARGDPGVADVMYVPVFDVEAIQSIWSEEAFHPPPVTIAEPVMPSSFQTASLLSSSAQTSPSHRTGGGDDELFSAVPASPLNKSGDEASLATSELAGSMKPSSPPAVRASSPQFGETESPVFGASKMATVCSKEEERYKKQYLELRSRKRGCRGVYPPSSSSVEYKGNVFDSFNLKVVLVHGSLSGPESGSVLAGVYRKVGFLGEATFSRVYKCKKLDTGEYVSVKMIRGEKNYVDQSLNEIHVLNYLNANTRNIHLTRCLKMLDYFYYNEHLYIVTELLGDDLYTLSTKLKQNGLSSFFSLGRLQKITYQILVGLEYIHSLDLIHCDLKPENIVVQSYALPLVKIIDFGSACFTSDKLPMYVQSRSYRAPEVLLGLPYDQKIDIWSLGCIIAELWTGYVLFHNEEIPVMLARMAGIIGQLPFYMVAKAHYARDLFTLDGQIFTKETKEAPSTIKGPRGIRILLPKQSSLRQRLRTTDEAFLDFMTNVLRIDPSQRLSATQALAHPWFKPGRYPDGL